MFISLLSTTNPVVLVLVTLLFVLVVAGLLIYTAGRMKKAKILKEKELYEKEYSNLKGEKKEYASDNTQKEWLNSVNGDTPVQLASQQGEEEFKQVEATKNGSDFDVDTTKTQVEEVVPEETLPKDEVEEVKVLKVEDIIDHLRNEGIKVETLEDKLTKPYVFYSRELLNANRYTVVGKYAKVEVSEEYPAGYKLQLAYAIIGAPNNKGKVDKFSRVKGRELATAKLDENKDVYDLSVSKEELNYPGRTFAIFAKSTVPLTVFDSYNRSLIHHFYSKEENYVHNESINHVTSTADEVEVKEFVEIIKKADYKHLVVFVHPVNSLFGDSLEVHGIYPFVDGKAEDVEVEQSTEETSSTQEPENTSEQAI